MIYEADLLTKAARPLAGVVIGNAITWPLVAHTYGRDVLTVVSLIFAVLLLGASSWLEEREARRLTLALWKAEHQTPTPTRGPAAEASPDP